MPLVARVISDRPTRAQLLVEEAGRWRPLLTLRGPDAEDRAQDLRRAVEAGVADRAALELADPAAGAA